VNFSLNSELLPLNSNVNDIQHFEPLNDISDYDILTFDDIPHSFNYQYNLIVGDCFDDWLSVNAFMHQYCLERDFGYQIFHSDKDPKDPTIIYHKSFWCLSSGVYKAQKAVDHIIHYLYGTIKMDCKWHCNFTFLKTVNQIRCTTLKDAHNHETSLAHILDIIPRYRHFNEEIIWDLTFFMDCKVAPITQLEILKKKYLEYVFHKQNVYNAIYKLNQSNGKLDTSSILNILFEKISPDPH